MKRIDKLEKFGILFLFIILGVLMVVVPNMNTDINTGKLIINEVMLINNNTIMDKYGKYSDYIELYNGNDYDVNLYGYYLTDNMKETRKWTFPDVTIKAKEYMIIFASGKDNTEDELHTNFKLDSKGETIALSNSSAKVISKVYVKETLKDTAYGYNGKKYVYYYNGTPGKENVGDYSNDPIYEVKSDYKIAISEYMTDNLSYKLSYDKKYYSLIELHNTDNKDINLEGFYLSDKEDQLTKYVFPDVTIKKDEYLVIYASGRNVYENNEIHTNFKLNNNDGILILSSPNKALINKVYLEKLETNSSLGLYKDKWQVYYSPSFGKENTKDYGKKEITKDIIINEVSIYPKEAIELYNKSDNDIKLDGYTIGDKNSTYKLDGRSINKHSYLVLYKSSFKFGINNTNEIITLTNSGQIIDTFSVNKLKGNISTGISNNKKVYYKTITLGSSNSSEVYSGFSEAPSFNIDGGYFDKSIEVKLSTNDGSTIYYTTNGSFPNKNSTKYTEPIKLTKTTVIKAISYKDGYIESDIISRTFKEGRHHDIAYVSISSDYNSLFGGSGLITNYTSNAEKKVSFEFYEADGSFGTSFISNAKLSGMDSRKEPQKSISIYLRKRYGQSFVNYPFFTTNTYTKYSSLLLRNAGEDPKGVRIMDAAISRIVEGEMDLDKQAYRPVVVYLNGSYYGIYNLREKLNGDYVESKFGIDNDNVNLIKYYSAVSGSSKDYNNIVNYINNHNMANKDSYEYVKKQIDVQELINYWIVESFFGNTDLGNIRYWKAKENGKWRWMLYDMDWSLWNMGLDMGYPIKSGRIPAATYLSSSINIVRKLYKNSEFKDLYLKSLSKYLKTTFKPDRMKKIVDELSKEIENEMPYHINKWGSKYSNLYSMSKWKQNLSSFKSTLATRYNRVTSNLRSYFNLSNSEYNKYFGDLK